MGSKGVVLGFGVGVLLAIAACSETNVTNNYWPDGGTGDGGPPDAGGDANQPSADGGSDASDSGRDAASDAGPVTAFTNAPAFAGGLGPSARTGGHASRPDQNMAGERCGNCHGSTAPTLVVSGTVYSDRNGTSVVPAAEVIVRFPDGGTHVVHADGDGNFFMRQSSEIKATPPGTLVGARTASASAAMPAALELGQGDCMGCHTSTPIHVP